MYIDMMLAEVVYKNQPVAVNKQYSVVNHKPHTRQ